MINLKKEKIEERKSSTVGKLITFNPCLILRSGEEKKVIHRSVISYNIQTNWDLFNLCFTFVCFLHLQVHNRWSEMSMRGVLQNARSFFPICTYDSFFTMKMYFIELIPTRNLPRSWKRLWGRLRQTHWRCTKEGGGWDKIGEDQEGVGRAGDFDVIHCWCKCNWNLSLVWWFCPNPSGIKKGLSLHMRATTTKQPLSLFLSVFLTLALLRNCSQKLWSFQACLLTHINASQMKSNEHLRTTNFYHVNRL